MIVSKLKRNIICELFPIFWPNGDARLLNGGVNNGNDVIIMVNYIGKNVQYGNKCTFCTESCAMWQSTSCTILNKCDGDLVEVLLCRVCGCYVRTNWKERCRVDVAHKHLARATPALTNFVIQIQFYDDYCINKGCLRFLVPSAGSSFLCSLCWWLLCVYLRPVGEYIWTW